MKFKVCDHTRLFSFNPSVDIEAARAQILDILRRLKRLVDEEFDGDEDFSEVKWVNERIAGLEDCKGINIKSRDAQQLVEQLWQVATIQEELDRISEPEAYPIISELAYLASTCLKPET